MLRELAWLLVLAGLVAAVVLAAALAAGVITVRTLS